MTTLTPTGSLRLLMDNLVALEETVHTDLVVYRWRPRSLPQLPCIWNWVGTSPFAVKDVAHWEDTIGLTVRLGIQHTDENDEMAQIEDYIDAFRDVVDGELWTNLPLAGTAKRAQRTGMRLVEDTFAGIPVLAAEFTFTFDLLRLIPAR